VLEWDIADPNTIEDTSFIAEQICNTGLDASPSGEYILQTCDFVVERLCAHVLQDLSLGRKCK